MNNASAILPPPGRRLPGRDPVNVHRGFAFAAWELWNHLPLWYCLFTVLTTGSMAMIYFNPSRPVLAATALFPLIWIAIFLYARFYEDPRFTHALKPTAAVIGSAVIALVAAILVLRPTWDSPVMVPIAQFYPGVTIDTAHLIKDGTGRVLLDARDMPMEQGKIMTVPDGRQYRVEGRGLVLREHKAELAAGMEVSNLIWAVLLLLHCLYFRHGQGVVIFFAATLAYGFLLESGGVTMDFFHEYDYRVYLPMLAAPAATMIGWALVFYASVSIFEMIERRWPRLKTANALIAGLVIALIALFWDVNVDPVATGLGLWTWHERLPPWFLGVPLVNFTSWLSAVFVYGVGYTHIQRRTGWSGRKKIAAMFAMIPILLVAAAVINFTLLGLVEGFHGPAWQVLCQP